VGKLSLSLLQVLLGHADLKGMDTYVRPESQCATLDPRARLGTTAPAVLN
jgi:hypothetical protein